jgi:hypothetical protein
MNIRPPSESHFLLHGARATCRKGVISVTEKTAASNSSAGSEQTLSLAYKPKWSRMEYVPRQILCEGTDPSEQILRTARERSVDLLVIGTRAHKGLAKLVLGSTAELLIHRVACPVLTIGPEARSPEEPLGFRHIVYATDFSSEVVPSGTKEVKLEIEAALKRNAEVDACRINVAIQGNKVILSGRVSSMVERSAAERAAWRAWGVGSVENNILISPPFMTGITA